MHTLQMIDNTITTYRLPFNPDFLIDIVVDNQRQQPRFEAWIYPVWGSHKILMFQRDMDLTTRQEFIAAAEEAAPNFFDEFKGGIYHESK